MHERFFQAVSRAFEFSQKRYTVTYNDNQKEICAPNDYHIVTSAQHENYKDAFRLAMIGALKAHPLATKYQIRNSSELGWNIVLRLNDKNEVVGEAIRAKENRQQNIKVIFSVEDTQRILSVLNDEYLVKLQYRNNFKM